MSFLLSSRSWASSPAATTTTTTTTPAHDALLHLLRVSASASASALLVLSTSVLAYAVVYYLAIPSDVAVVADVFLDYDAPRNQAHGAFAFARVELLHRDAQWTLHALAPLDEEEEDVCFPASSTPSPNQHQRRRRRRRSSHHDAPSPPLLGLSPNHPYNVWLHLTIPETPTNLASHTFMVDTTILASSSPHGTNGNGNDKHNRKHKDERIATSRRPVTLSTATFVTRLLSDVVLAVPRVLGYFPPTQTISLLCMESFTAPPEPEPTTAEIRLYASSRPRRQRHPISVSKARLAFELQLFGVRYWMYHWFYTCALLGVSALMAIQATLLTGALVVWSVRTAHEEDLLAAELVEVSSSQIE